MGYETELPATVDDEDSGENTQPARDIQQRAIALYGQTIGDKNSKGPAESQWRVNIENLVFGRFDQRHVRCTAQPYTFANTKIVRFRKAKEATSEAT